VTAPPPWTGAPHPPRRWQADALPLVMASLRSRTRGLVYACTGSGKSVLLAEVVHQVLATMREGWVVVVTVPTQELVDQLAATVAKRVGRASVGVYYGRRKVRRPRRVHVVCLRSLDAYAEWHDAHGLRTALWIGDEAHRAETYGERVNRLSPVTRLGVTATPYLADDGLDLWDRTIYQYRLTQAIADGVLVPLRVVSGWGDDDGPLTPRVVDICRHAGRWTMVDAGPTVEGAETMAADLRAAGVDAEAIHSRQPKREFDARLERFRAGDLAVLCQVDTLSEGVDLPPLRSLVMARRTVSAVRRVQLVGRILRTHPGKAEGVVYDVLRQLRGSGDLDRDALLTAMESDADREARTLTRAEVREMELEASLPLARARQEVADWTMGLAAGLRDAGLLPPLPADGGEGGDASMWRDRPVPPGMLAEIERRRKATRWLDEPLREAVAPLLDRPEDLSIGAATDLLDVLRAASRAAADAYQRCGDWRQVHRTVRVGLPDGVEVPAAAVMRIARKTLHD